MQLKAEIRRSLLEQGFSISSWARAKGFSTTYVHQIIKRYHNSNGNTPNSPTVYKIIKLIKNDTGVDLLKVEK